MFNHCQKTGEGYILDNVTGYDVIVIGAGPVGLMLANLLGRLELRVLVLERSLHASNNPRAIGVSIPSLEILQSLGLDSMFLSQGVPVRHVGVYGERKRLGSVSFQNVGSRFDCILSIPQNMTEKILEDNLNALQSVTMLRGYTVLSVMQDSDGIRISGSGPAEENFDFESSFAVACDGGRSSMREAVSIPFNGAAYRDTFLMGDFVDHTDWGSEARIFLTKRGSVESFPLPHGLRRYVLPTPRYIPEYTSRYLEEEVPLRCGTRFLPDSKVFESGFTVQRFIAGSYSTGRLLFAGDSAHLMSPIGGQNMNTGFADAEFLSNILPRVLANRTLGQPLFAMYERIRKRAANTAAFRAWMVMRLVTSGGAFRSPLRNAMVKALIRGPFKWIVPSIFSMMSIPFRNLADPKSSILDRVRERA